MYKSIFVVLIVMAFAACNNDTQTKNTASVTDSTGISKDYKQIPDTQCYASMNGRDTVLLKLQKLPNAATGSLTYKLFEKDTNKGTVDGKLRGDTLIADYVFMSEGKKSVRQVAFLIRDSVATEGYGEMEEKNGKMVFKNMAAIDFSKGIKLQKITCPVE
jgi:hypothetical protein